MKQVGGEKFPKLHDLCPLVIKRRSSLAITAINTTRLQLPLLTVDVSHDLRRLPRAYCGFRRTVWEVPLLISHPALCVRLKKHLYRQNVMRYHCRHF